MELSQKNTTRWQRLTHGYNKYWYCKAALRWLALVTAVVTLITFGATWRDYTLYSQYDVGYVYESLAITCPLIAVIVDVFAIVLLFRTRKNSNINPVFLLAGDTLTLPLLIIDMAITCPGEFGFHVSTASVEFPLVMVWGLTYLGNTHFQGHAQGTEDFWFGQSPRPEKSIAGLGKRH
ncbi:hypothetical protein D6D23_06016 [Aureobasidium pullulans]|nr:hypothetical protein D6D23_06016 [Aureobasidium pullulans]